MNLRKTLAVSAAALLVLAGCSSDDDAAPTDGATTDVEVDGGGGDAPATDDDGGSGDAPDGAATSGGTGTLMLGDDTIELSGALCYLQEQDSAGGGGKILFTGQATGVNADGEDVMIDVSRYDEDSLFAGDSIDVVVGDYIEGESKSYANMPGDGLDAISVDGSTISAQDVELIPDDMDGNVTVSFEINC